MDDRPAYLNTSGLRIALGETWYCFIRYFNLGIIPDPDAVSGNNRPLWLTANVESIKARIADYHRKIELAKANELSTTLNYGN